MDTCPFCKKVFRAIEEIGRNDTINNVMRVYEEVLEALLN